MELLSYILEQGVNGLQLGAVYALIALGYTMVYGVLRLINFAHGDIFMFGAFTAYFLITKWNLPIYLVFVVTIFATALLGYAVEKIAYKPLRSAPRISLLITAVGVSLFLEYFLSLKGLFGPDYIAFPRPFDVRVFDLGFLSVTNVQLIIFSVTAVSLLLLYLLVYRTRHGRAMRAVSHDPEVAALMGINIDGIISFTFLVGTGLAGIGGILYAFAYPQINVFMGIMPGIKSFIAAVLGGIGLIHGAVVGGIIIGMLEVFVSAFLSSTFRDGVIFIVLLLVLLLRPNGLFGRRIDKL
jgi:branched-chain amino acid transport system permease protein